MRAVQVTVDVPRQGRERSAPLPSSQDQWECGSPSFERTNNYPIETAAANTAPAMDLVSDRGDNEDVEELSPSPKRICRSDNPPCSSHPPFAFSRRSTNHTTSVFASTFPTFPVSSSIEVE